MQLKILFVTLLIAIITSSSCTSVEKIRYTTEELLEQMRQAHIESVHSEDVSEITERQPEMIGGQQAIYSILVYPNNARRNEVQGRVDLMVTVSEEGIPVDIEVTNSVHPELDRAAVNAMSQMLFIPAVKNGERVRVQLTNPVIFRLGL